jgi:hypothetical protein
MNTNKKKVSLIAGYKVVGRGIAVMAKDHLLVFLWVNFFATWFIGGGALMLYLGSTSWLPLVCVLTPLVALTWLPLNASIYGFSRLLGVPRAVPWLVAMFIAVQELVSVGYVGQPDGYYVWLVGFIVINGIATLLDFVDIFRWTRGERAEHINTGFFETAQ